MRYGEVIYNIILSFVLGNMLVVAIYVAKKNIK